MCFLNATNRFITPISERTNSVKHELQQWWIRAFVGQFRKHLQLQSVLFLFPLDHCRHRRELWRGCRGKRPEINFFTHGQNHWSGHYNRDGALSDPTPLDPETKTPPYLPRRPRTWSSPGRRNAGCRFCVVTSLRESTAPHHGPRKKGSVHLDLQFTNTSRCSIYRSRK